MSASPLSPRDYFDSLAFFGIKLGLDNIRALLDAEGNPHLRLRCVHIAGTNGKGSVSAFLDSIARAAGYRTGRFTSPHLLDVTERFLLDALPLSGDALDRRIEACRGHAERLGIVPTYFELCTAIAFDAFAEAGVDLAIIETGMGGRLDSTNVVEPAAVCITNIGWDHMEHLGDTLEKIAAEKAGIIKPGVPLVAGPLSRGPAGVIEAAAAAAGAGAMLRVGQEITLRSSGTAWSPEAAIRVNGDDLGPVPLPLAGWHQTENAALAAALALTLRTELPRITRDAIETGLRQTQWPCRLERVCNAPPVIVDAAHNAAGMQGYHALFSQAVVVVATSSDKDYRAILDTLAPFASPLICTRYTGPRAAAPSTLADASGGDTVVAQTLEEALELGVALAGKERPLLITGSIFLAGEARAWLADKGLARPLRF